MTDAAAYSVSVRDVPIDAFIGVNPDEQNRRQPLFVSVDAVLDAPRPLSQLADTIDYCAIAAAARQVAEHHIGLIEHYARLVGERCLALGPVASVTVTVAKPNALAAGMAATTVRLERPASANVIPFAALGRADTHVVRFAFQDDVNVHAQHALARFVRHLAGSLRGLALEDVSFDPRAGEWTAQVKLTGQGAPRVEDIRFPARVGRRDAQ